MERKLYRDSFKNRQQRVTELGELIHADLCGPMGVCFLERIEILVCFTCDYTRYRMVYLLKEKAETVEKIAEMLRVVKNQYGRSAKQFQCGGREFENKLTSF